MSNDQIEEVKWAQPPSLYIIVQDEWDGGKWVRPSLATNSIFTLEDACKTLEGWSKKTQRFGSKVISSSYYSYIVESTHPLKKIWRFYVVGGNPCG